MSFNSLDLVLKAIQKQQTWVAQEQYSRLKQCWQEVVGEKVTLHTRPLYITRQVLWVATSSSVWAQELSLKRYTLLKKLNAHLSEKLVDLRFSPGKWHDSSINSYSNTPEEHPSSVVSEVDLRELPKGDTPQSAFQRWAEVIKRRSQLLPLCPNCQVPTPPGELERWSVCAYCSAQKWSELPNLKH